jgi:hypothetical protein
MTGFTTRIQRDGRWTNLDLDELTDDELFRWSQTMLARAPTGGWSWAVSLAAWIRDHVREADRPIEGSGAITPASEVSSGREAEAEAGEGGDRRGGEGGEAFADPLPPE